MRIIIIGELKIILSINKWRIVDYSEANYFLSSRVSASRIPAFETGIEDGRCCFGVLSSDTDCDAGVLEVHAPSEFMG